MDDQKDTQKTESLAKFIDGSNVRVNPFGDNRAADRAYKRAERIASAIHLLTNHINQDDSLKRYVRNESTVLLSYIIELRDEMRSAQSSNVIRVLSSIRHIISLMRLLAVSGSASLQNATAVIEALDELGNFLTASQRSTFSESVIISRDELLDIAASGSVRHTPLQIKDRGEESREQSGLTSGLQRPVQPHAVQPQSSLNVRAQNIVEILKTGGTQGIKEICSTLPEYSEKMIQRELLGLVEAGVISKVGLKRWSRYSIAQSSSSI